MLQELILNKSRLQGVNQSDPPRGIFAEAHIKKRSIQLIVIGVASIPLPIVHISEKRTISKNTCKLIETMLGL